MKLLMILSLVVVSFASINASNAGIISATSNLHTTEDNVKPEKVSWVQVVRGKESNQ